ncbi:hypothetical protein B484DRAFT_437136, partial [Ochromonadaceae sp. CCMP2298]
MRRDTAALSASASEILADLKINKRTKAALVARLTSARKIRSQVKNLLTVLVGVRDGTLPARALGKKELTKSHAAGVKRESMVVLKWSAAINVSYLERVADLSEPGGYRMVIRYRTDYCDSERFLRFTQAQTRRTTDVGESLQTAGDVEVFLHNTSGVKRRRRSLASLYINQYWRTVGAVTDTDNVEGSTIALSDVRLLIGLLYSQFIYNAKVVQLISFKHVVIDKAEASFDKIALFGASLQRKMFPEETGNLDRTTRYTCVPNLVLCELASAHHTREIGQFLHDHNNGVNGITITELLEFVKRCKRVSLHLFTAMGATVACYSPQVKAGTTVHSIIGLISDDHVL